MTTTIKFSQFANGGLLTSDKTAVGLSGGINTQFQTPLQFVADFTNSTQPVSPPIPSIGFNTTIGLFQIYNGTWVTLSAGSLSGTVNPGLANQIGYYVSNGTEISGITGTGTGIPVLQTAPTLISPITNTLQFTDGRGILDDQGNELIFFASTAASTIYIGIYNTTTGNAPLIAALGSDSNITLALSGKGTGGVGLHGTSTNDNASPGYVGEFVDSGIIGPTNFTMSVTPQNLTSISITPGDWDINAGFFVNPLAATTTAVLGGISTISMTVPTTGDTAFFLQSYNGVGVTGIGEQSFNPYTRLSVAATTTVYLVMEANWTGTAPQGYGRLTARRAR